MRLILHFTLFAVLVVFCSCASHPHPPKRVRLPASLNEVSGLSVGNDSLLWLHNDSGDGPNLFRLDLTAATLEGPWRISAGAQDWEDICQAPDGTIFIGDFGNNAGRREQQTIYRLATAEAPVAAINFTYPGQDGAGRSSMGNHDCEAIIWYQGQLHLFTKALPGKRKAYWSYHFQLPTEPGNYVATLVDSIYLPRRVITGAALEKDGKELVLVTYNYKRWLGFFPAVASSLITLRNFPEGRFFQGQLHRRNLSWGFPVQYESVDYFDERFLYVGSEKVSWRSNAFLKRKKRKANP